MTRKIRQAHASQQGAPRFAHAYLHWPRSKRAIASGDDQVAPRLRLKAGETVIVARGSRGIVSKNAASRKVSRLAHRVKAVAVRRA